MDETYEHSYLDGTSEGKRLTMKFEERWITSSYSHTCNRHESTEGYDWFSYKDKVTKQITDITHPVCVFTFISVEINTWTIDCPISQYLCG
jgi:hypothetical protein